ncbi:PKD domain-containing protein [Paenibacillus hexagrammi]|uniref:PKD domain-containing protein n=1 Tax=Paenibacillus hexagrammi TaxID=2908839 RepID=A0ABY3SFG3_9BACL|nr:PKD domain-containing protein [Paenibacillus sp. YPD9-1]UJF31921.1 PKD domain-containing protein [Paenibacillus sp. YPD9-1]
MKPRTILTYFYMVNSPPAAVMQIPAGSKDNPTVFNSLRPTIQWEQTDPDPGTIFRHAEIQITNETNDVLILDTGELDQWTSSNTGSWTVDRDLPAGQKLRVRVRVSDGMVWSEYSAQTWLYINRAPHADFDWSPKPVWEGDQVTLVNLSTDEDGDPLQYEWQVLDPDGHMETYNTLNVGIKFLQPGSYTVTLTVFDGYDEDRVVKVITALPLTIESDVSHTTEWLDYHQSKGHRTDSPPKDFYSGEIFMVSTRSSPAPVDEVTAWIDTDGLDGRALYAKEVLDAQSDDPTLYQGELFDERFLSLTAGLPEGLQTIHFEIRYHNGVVRLQDIPITIIGSVQKTVGVHRVQ